MSKTLCMNTGKPVPFIQTGEAVLINASQLIPDPVDTIIKIEFRK